MLQPTPGFIPPPVPLVPTAVNAILPTGGLLVGAAAGAKAGALLGPKGALVGAVAGALLIPLLFPDPTAPGTLPGLDPGLNPGPLPEPETTPWPDEPWSPESDGSWDPSEFAIWRVTWESVSITGGQYQCDPYLPLGETQELITPGSWEGNQRNVRIHHAPWTAALTYECGSPDSGSYVTKEFWRLETLGTDSWNLRSEASANDGHLVRDSIVYADPGQYRAIRNVQVFRNDVPIPTPDETPLPQPEPEPQPRPKPIVPLPLPAPEPDPLKPLPIIEPAPEPEPLEVPTPDNPKAPPVTIPKAPPAPPQPVPGPEPKTTPRPLPIFPVPLPTPLPVPLPQTPTVPEPSPDPDPQPAPGPAPDPQPLPGTTPGPEPWTPPGPEPQEVPLPLPPTPLEPGPITTPVSPETPVGTEPDGALTPAPSPAPVPVPPNVHFPVTGQPGVTPGGTRPELAAIAAEVGRIEQKVARMQQPGGIGDLADLLRLLMALMEFFEAPIEGITYELQGICEDVQEGQGQPVAEFEVPEAKNFDAIVQRLDVMQDLFQQHLAYRTPICRGHRRQGDIRTIHFISDEVSAGGKRRLDKRLRYRSQSGTDLGGLIDHWSGFTWQAGPVIVEHIDGPWGSVQVWASSIDEGKRVIRHAAGEAGFDPDQAGRWTVSGSTNSRYGLPGTMRVCQKGGYWWITARDGPSERPIVGKT